MGPSPLAYALAISLRPLLRTAAQQLTLLGRVSDLEHFSVVWLGGADLYARLGSLGLIELASAVQNYEFGLAIIRLEFSDDWEEVDSIPDRWLASTRLNTVRSLSRAIRRWKREHGWQQIGMD